MALQQAALRRYAETHGLDIIRTYADVARSGVTLRRRSALTALLADVVAGAPFCAILVYDVSRWGRFQDTDEAGHYEFLCRQAGVEIRYCAEPFINDGSPAAALLKSAVRVMAGEYSRQLSDRIRAGKRRQVAAGMTSGGPAPYGFARQIVEPDGSPGRILAAGEERGDLQRVRLVAGPAAEVRTVQRIFREFVQEGLPVSQIADTLAAAGLLHRRGAWTTQRVRAALENSLAAGQFQFNRTTQRLGHTTSNPPELWGTVAILPPLVPIKLWRAAQARLAEPRVRGKTDAQMIDALRGLLATTPVLTRKLINAAPGLPGGATYARRFGSLAAAYALVPYVRASAPTPPPRTTARRRPGPRPGQYSADDLVAGLRRLLEVEGYLSLALIRRCPYLPTERYLYRHFGSLPAAYAAAGFVRSRSDLVKAGLSRTPAKPLDDDHPTHRLSGLRPRDGCRGSQR